MSSPNLSDSDVDTASAAKFQPWATRMRWTQELLEREPVTRATRVKASTGW